MRYTFAKTLLELAKKDKRIVLMTGDLGAHLFEPLREVLKERFINTGVAEHNMVTAAAGLAYAGLKPWIYSIAPFVTIKVLEEIRNDVSIPNNNVKIVGLGGGYDYAIAGPTHHILQDVSMILSLQNFKVYAPGFSEGIEEIMKKMNREKNPSYLRLAKAEKTDFKIAGFVPVRRLVKGTGLTVIVLGSMINRVMPAYSELTISGAVDLWLVTEMPFEFPKELVVSIEKTKKLVVIEEHVKIGALGSYIADFLLQRRIELKKYAHLYAKGYISYRYGSRDFYLKESGLDRNTIKKTLKKLI
ncbi:hypothetical protein A2774_04940 [Candidatus Roizmanbacteria bacterium RIFCSPHIGHO2_01_FULL_39_12c]|uniref:Transketolase-like pyrimidine-binding domain-containing protein n=1 Tax=Candidatus Roizmanbacteria bacterium RIFCSPHIGHO2_01_FULL_39_12c TaxID=1802031 RepID=A0A1F7GB90_9BACT|nr:MAG: hypothetical protein A2774_04940 [Candidatus Roizmanbacteria bacterium RIFCSPHIGHO2_01_FULL_39_12c]